MFPTWNAQGIVTEARELKTKEGAKVWAYACKLACTGVTLEVQTKDESLFRQAGAGVQGVAKGSFELFNGALKLVLTQFTPAK